MISMSISWPPSAILASQRSGYILSVSDEGELGADDAGGLEHNQGGEH